MSGPPLRLIDETLRDGPQSLWGSMIRTETLAAIAPALDRAGFDEVVVGSAALFEAAVKYLRQDPWERLRLLRAAMPRTPLRYLIRGRNLMGWSRFPNDVAELMVRCLERIGIDWIMVFDGLNDIRNIEYYFDLARAVGVKCSGIVCFSESPVHTDDYFVAKVREILKGGVDKILLYDASGVLTPARARTLIPALLAAIDGAVPLELTAHTSTGTGLETLLEGVRLGVRTVFTASRPLAYGDSIPATLDVVARARACGIPVPLDEDAVREAEDYLAWAAWKERKPRAEPAAFDPVEHHRYASHQIPGGMMSNLVRQLRDLGLEHRLPEILEEAAQVRRELGYPIMVTPMSQLVGVQATLNVIEGERYRTAPHELRMYLRGGYGQPAGPIDPDVVDRVLRPGDTPIDPTEHFLTPYAERVRRQDGPFDSDEELLLWIFYGRDTMTEFRRVRQPMGHLPRPEGALPALLRELAARPILRSVRIEKGSLKIRWGTMP